MGVDGKERARLLFGGFRPGRDARLLQLLTLTSIFYSHDSYGAAGAMSVPACS